MRFSDQGIGVFVVLLPVFGLYRGVVGSRVGADLRILGGGVDHKAQVFGGRNVLEVESGRFVKAAAVHTEALGFTVHGGDKCAHAAGVGSAQCMGGAVFAAHQAQVQQFFACKCRTYGKTAAGPFEAVDFVGRNGNGFVHVQVCIQNDHRAHQFGNGGDGHNPVGVFLIQYLSGFVVDDQGRL